MEGGRQLQWSDGDCWLRVSARRPPAPATPSAHAHALQRLLEEKQEALSAMVRKVEGLATVEPAQQAELESLLTEVEALDQALDALPT